MVVSGQDLSVLFGRHMMMATICPVKPLLRGMCDFAILYDVDLSLGKIGATALIASAVISGAVPMLINAIKGVLMKMIETEVLWDIVLCSGLIAGAVLLEEP